MANANPTPRARFHQVAANLSAHRALLETAAFERACDTALLEYQRRLADNARLASDAAVVGLKLTGAVELVSVMRNLAEKTEPASPPPNDNLNPTT